MDAPPVQYVTTSDGYSIAYCVSGAGTPFVFMPNPFSHVQLYWRTPGAFRHLYEELTQRFKLVCYDSRGLGMSSRGLSEDFRIEEFELDLEAVVEHLQLDRLVLLAQQNFGRVAIRYATRCPKRVQALILWNADAGDVSPGTPFAPSQLEELARVNWDLYVETMARIAWTPEDPVVARKFVRESVSQSDWLRRTQAWRSYTVADTLSEVSVPTLVIANSTAAYQFATEEASKHIAAQIPNARLVVFDDPIGGLFSRGPETLAGVRLIEDFVKGLAPAPTAPGLPSHGLSGREIEVLRLIAAGKSNAQIAEELVITLNTVQHHVSNILTKTGLASRGEAAAYAHRNGLV